jgi:hypothetical protein
MAFAKLQHAQIFFARQLQHYCSAKICAMPALSNTALLECGTQGVPHSQWDDHGLGPAGNTNAPTPPTAHCLSSYIDGPCQQSEEARRRARTTVRVVTG